MKLTTKGRFAVTALADLAMQPGGASVTLAGISARQKISLSYLEQLFGNLRRHDLVVSARGPGGGYRLARSSADISIADIVLAVDEPMDPRQADQGASAANARQCKANELWNGLADVILGFLAATSLQQLVEGHGPEQKEMSAPADMGAGMTTRRGAASGATAQAAR